MSRQSKQHTQRQPAPKRRQAVAVPLARPLERPATGRAASDWGEVAWAAALAGLLAGTLYVKFGDLNLNLADEGFLWYGALRTAAGEVPLRDFQSYELGRYYWAVAWFPLLGDGVLGLRLSCAILQVIGLFCGLLVARRIVPNRWWLLPIGIVLAVWMFPYYKYVDASCALVAVYVAVRLIEVPSLRGHFFAGCFVGLASFFGRNHGLYSGLGLGCLILFLAVWLRAGDLWRKWVVFGAGVIVGGLPLLAMMAFVPGVARVLVGGTVFLLKQGSNLPWPAPWPWRFNYAPMSWSAAAANFSLGTAFLLLPVVYGLGVLAALRTTADRLAQRSVLIAATLIGVFYIHHSAVRSDAEHLSQSIGPMLLGFFGIPAAYGYLGHMRATLATWSFLAAITFFAVTFTNPALIRLGPGTQPAPLVRYNVRGDTLRLPTPLANYLGHIEMVVSRHVRPEEGMFIAPSRATLYPLLGKVSPVWRIYFLWTGSDAEQQEIIRSLSEKDVNWALIVDTPAADGRPELRFRTSNAAVWQYLTTEFDLVQDPDLPKAHLLFKRRSR